jgi:hypothetical protein
MTSIWTKLLAPGDRRSRTDGRVPLTDARLLCRNGSQGTAKIVDLQIFPSLSGSLVDPGCICLVDLVVLDRQGTSARQVRVQQRMSQAMARRLSATDSAVPVWIDQLQPKRVALDIEHPDLRR